MTPTIYVEFKFLAQNLNDNNFAEPIFDKTEFGEGWKV